MLNKTEKGNKVAYIGAIEDNAKYPPAVQKKYVENAIEAIIGGKTPAVTKTKAIGCTISQ